MREPDYIVTGTDEYGHPSLEFWDAIVPTDAERNELIELLLPRGLTSRSGDLYEYHRSYVAITADAIIAAGWRKNAD